MYGKYKSLTSLLKGSCYKYTIYIDGPPGRPGSGCVNFIALTAVLRREFHYTPFRAKDMKIMAVKIKRRRPRHDYSL